MNDYVNHSCCSNSGVRILNTTVELVSTSSIQRGDQITFNYATMIDKNWGELHCKCGSASCGQVVKISTDLSSSTKKNILNSMLSQTIFLQKYNIFNMVRRLSQLN